MNRRLSLMMFLQYAIPGAWSPIFSLHLQELHFAPHELAWACGTSALGALLAPLLWGQIADRWLPTQHCISLCSFLGGALLFLLAELTTPVPVFCAALGFWFFTVPLFSLGTALTFRHLKNPEGEYGKVRLWGTVGWVTMGLLMWHWLSNPAYLRPLLDILRPDHPQGQLADALRLGGGVAWMLSLYSLTLPHTPPSPRKTTLLLGPPRGWLRAAFDAPLLALRLFRQPSFLVFCICLMGLYITIPFSSQMTPLLLRHLGVPANLIPPTLTLAQSLEVVSLACLPIFLLRLEVKGTLLLGILAWTLALAVLSVGQPTPLVIASLGLHGVFITCYVVAGQVFVNRRAQKDIRASAQALLQFLNGIGLLAGHLLVGWIRTRVEGEFGRAFAVATILSAVLVVCFVLGFRTRAE